MIASLTVIIFHVIRHQILHGDGLPLSLVGSGFTFQKMDFLWSPSIWSGVRGTSAIFQRFLVFLSFFIIGLLCLTIGPASAVLMLPRPIVSSHKSSFSLLSIILPCLRLDLCCLGSNYLDALLLVSDIEKLKFLINCERVDVIIHGISKLSFSTL